LRRLHDAQICGQLILVRRRCSVIAGNGDCCKQAGDDAQASSPVRDDGRSRWACPDRRRHSGRRAPIFTIRNGAPRWPSLHRKRRRSSSSPTIRKGCAPPLGHYPNFSPTVSRNLRKSPTAADRFPVAQCR
jgi:hypothetical protein